MHKQESGFTLIELVVVISILAILTAVALPKYADMQAQARIGKMNGAMGSVKAASTLSHALLLANQYAANYTGNPSSPDINVEGVDATYELGYPTADIILPLAGIGGTAATTAAGAAGDYYVVSVTGTTLTLAPDANHQSCTITYTEATGTSVTPTYSTAGLTVTNCG